MPKIINFKTKGNFNNLNSFFQRSLETINLSELDEYGKEGVKALSSNTPVNTGLTANSWYYDITREDEKITITWRNSHVENGVNIALILQYGHGTKNGGYVQGIDYINPSIKPIFENMLKRRDMK